MSDDQEGALEAPDEPQPEAEPAPSPALAGFLAHVQRLKATPLKDKRVTMAIDGLRYASTKLPALTGLDLWARALAMFGADMLRALVTGSIENVSTDEIVRAAIRANQLGLGELVRELLASVEVNELDGIKSAGNVSDAIDSHFAGEYMHLLKVCQFVLAHNLLGPCRGGR